MKDNYEQFGKEWEKEMMKWSKAELIDSLRSLAKSKEGLTVKGRYIMGPYDEFQAFECSECRSAMTVVDDPKAEQPKYCHGCGAKFDWEGVYEALIREFK